MTFISIILPTYCEAGNIVNLIKALIKHIKLQSKTYKLEIVVIDDDSPDGTAQEVQKLIKQKLPVKIFIRKNQRGLATAIALGIKKAKGNIIVLMDTDFNHLPKDLPRLLKPILNQKADLVIGSRYIASGGMHATVNKLQFFLSKYGNFFVNRILLRLPVYESLSGFVVFKRSILQNLNLSTIFQGYGDYCIRLLFKINQQGFTIAEVPVIYGKRQWGESKTNLIKIFFDYLITSFKLRFNLI
ncbi:polyprenol monophosphomannose synthase [Patescibacteria group bacterium]